MAGPSRPLPAGIFRVRPLRPVRSAPAGAHSPDGVQTRLQSVDFFASAPKPQGRRRPLALRYGSDLLPLRLRSPCSRVMRFFTPPHLRRLTGFARPAHSAPPRLPCAPSPFRNRTFWRGSPAGKRDCVLVRAVATITLWVTASVRRSKRPGDLTRLERGFSSRLAAQLLIRAELDRSRHRPEELVISACRPRCRGGGAGGTSCHRPFPGRPGLSQPCSR